MWNELLKKAINLLKTLEYTQIKMPNGTKYKLFPDGKIIKISKKS